MHKIKEKIKEGGAEWGGGRIGGSRSLRNIIIGRDEKEEGRVNRKRERG